VGGVISGGYLLRGYLVSSLVDDNFTGKIGNGKVQKLTGHPWKVVKMHRHRNSIPVNA